MKRSVIREQIIPIVLTLIIFLTLCLLLFLSITALNLLPSTEKIHIMLRPQDIAVGLTIYLKTSIDFAIFIGNLMKANSGWKNRIAIELGTAAGNALGTILILTIWNFFREVPLLMAVMVFVASLVLLRMAEESLEELQHAGRTIPPFVRQQLKITTRWLHIPNRIFSPLLRFLSSGSGLMKMEKLSWRRLFIFAATIPFILGLDDFAGYLPLFNIINVFGFAVGVFLGHMLLNIALFISPKHTVRAVRNDWVLAIGGIAFIGLSIWGMYEVFRLVVSIIH